MAWARVFHRPIMTIGGTRPTPARTAQLDAELRFPARPAINTAEIQTPASTVSSDTRCMPPAYARGLNGAVPECTQGRKHSNRGLCTSAQTRDCEHATIVMAYAVHRRPRRRGGRGHRHPQIARAGWPDRRPSRLDERAVACRASRLAPAVMVRRRRRFATFRYSCQADPRARLFCGRNPQGMMRRPGKGEQR